MGQSPSSVRSKGSRRSFRVFVRRSKHNKSSLSHTFSLPPSEEYPELMNVNTATEEQLMTLPGVNRQLAREIVRHRQMIGRFKRVDDLALVSGIGAEKLELLRPEICTYTKKQISRASSCTYSLDSFRLPTDNKLCSVNSSSVFQLQCVPGLNQELAANIVDYRNKKGPFKSLDDLIKVRGIDIVRLSTVKPHLSLEPRKCESAQQLVNGNGNLSNGWNDQSPKDSQSNESKTPKTPHRKSLSMPPKFPITLPNGFATAPVNDILDLLSAYSHRPIVEEVFMYERYGIRCCRVASWNLHQLNKDKITNPGVREVVCRTMLEYRITVLAIQDVLDEDALKMICDELNAPTLRRVKEYKSMSHSWQYCVLAGQTQNLGFIFESSNKHIFMEPLSLEQVEKVTGRRVAPLADALCAVAGDNLRIYPQAFLICDHPIVLVNVQCKVATLSEQDSDKLREIADAALESRLQLAFVGEFVRWENARPLDNCESLLNEEIITSVDAATTGRSAILCAGQLGASQFNGHSGVVRSGLCHLGIPRGWSWGGPASPFCPIYAELNVPD